MIMRTISKILSVIIISSLYLTWYAYTDNQNNTISSDIDTKINLILDSFSTEGLNSFETKVLKNNNLVLEDGVWYTYVYTSYKSFWEWVIPTNADIKNNWLNNDSTILVLDDKSVYFVNEYKKVKLISDYIISWISNKNEFLNNLAEDKKYFHNDTDELFLKLKDETQNLTSGLSYTAKIYKIYDYVIENIDYTIDFDISKKEVFSWIETYQNKDWVCAWYTKLALYMLSFAWIDSAEVIKWDVIDSTDFPYIWHAWLKIWNLYFDPTFDDPIWNTKTKTTSEYKYFGLPEDLFYTDRYNYWDLPQYLLNESLETREDIVKENISKLVSKYENKSYLLLKPFVFRKNNNLTYNEDITIEKLKNIVTNFDVNNYKYIENNQIKTISHLNYYTVNDSNIELLLEQIKYDISWFALLNWDDWSYRLAKNITNTLAYDK